MWEAALGDEGGQAGTRVFGSGSAFARRQENGSSAELWLLHASHFPSSLAVSLSPCGAAFAPEGMGWAVSKGEQWLPAEQSRSGPQVPNPGRKPSCKHLPALAAEIK